MVLCTHIPRVALCLGSLGFCLGSLACGDVGDGGEAGVSVGASTGGTQSSAGSSSVSGSGGEAPTTS